MINLSSLNKGLVGHWRLGTDFQKVGSELITDTGFDDSGQWDLIGTAIGSSQATITGDSTNNWVIMKNAVNVFTSVVGRTYILTYDIASNTLVGSGTVTMGQISGTEAFPNTAYADLTVGQHSQLVVADYAGADARVSCMVSDGYTGGTLVLNSLSLKPALIADLTPYGNHCSNYGVTFTTDRKGNADRAGDFDGSSSSLFGDMIVSGDNDLSIGLWLNFDDVGTLQHILTNTDGANDRLFIAVTAFGILEARRLNSVTTYSKSGAITTGWHHVIATFTGATLLLYIDSIPQVGASNTTSVSQGSNLTIGSNSVIYFDGQIEEVKFWNRVLSADEVLALYNSYRSNLEIT